MTEKCEESQLEAEVLASGLLRSKLASSMVEDKNVGPISACDHSVTQTPHVDA